MSAEANRIQAMNAAIANECPICQCDMVLPFTIPGCGHKFCFICLKGVSITHMGGCPICRGPIDAQIFRHPSQNLDLKMGVPGSPSPSTSSPVGVVKTEDEDVKPDVNQLNAPPKMYWLYQGRNRGWWRFDPRNEKDVEEAFTNGMPLTEVTICGMPYIIDFTDMTQYPKNRKPSSREIKRVNATEFDEHEVKGMAGIFHTDS